MVDLTRMIEGGMNLAGAFGGGGGNSSSYRTAMSDVARMEALVADAASKRNTLQAQLRLGSDIERMGGPAELASVLAAGHDPTKLSGYMGDMQEQGFRSGAVERALAGDWDGGNANLMGVANGPQALGAVQGQNLLSNVFREGGGGISTTEQGRAGIAADAARARASDASAASSYATADSTRQRLGIAKAQFDLQRQGQWNPGGKTAAAGGGQKPLPVGALKELLGVEDALGSAQVMSDIIQKHTGRLKDGELQISPFNSALAWGRTKAGQATDGDVMLNEWGADKTKLVNESLRLNKGVQTEGDAQRAVAELMGANDPATASRALKRLAELNIRAVELQQRKAGLINENYGRTTGSSQVEDAFLGGQAAPAASPTNSDFSNLWK